MALIISEWAMAKVCIFQILAVDSYPLPFHLFPLFHVPQIQKNLITVNQFTRDNHVFIEFHPAFFCVKDLRTRQLLLQGLSKLGLYPWPSFAAASFWSPAAFLGEKVSLD